jgi:flagellar motility protein MotE (MotC chaperone)
MFRKILLSIFVCVLCLWLAATAAVFLFRKELATHVLGITASDAQWAQSQEVQGLVKAVGAWEKQMAVDEKARKKEALRLGQPYEPPRFEFAVDEAMAKFPPAELKAALRQMRPDSAALVLAHVPDPPLRDALLAELPADQQEGILDWMALRKEKEAMEEEKDRLLRQKRRMEAFQDSLDKQQKSLYELQAAVREEMKDIQVLQEQMSQQFIAVQESEREGLARTAKMYNEMKADEIARIMESETGLPELRAIKILSMMDEDKAAKVLGVLQPSKAGKFTEALGRLRQEPRKAETGFGAPRGGLTPRPAGKPGAETAPAP